MDGLEAKMLRDPLLRSHLKAASNSTLPYVEKFIQELSSTIDKFVAQKQGAIFARPGTAFIPHINICRIILDLHDTISNPFGVCVDVGCLWLIFDQNC